MLQPELPIILKKPTWHECCRSTFASPSRNSWSPTMPSTSCTSWPGLNSSHTTRCANFSCRCAVVTDEFCPDMEFQEHDRKTSFRCHQFKLVFISWFHMHGDVIA